jgi:hypothetical protein
MSLIFDHFKTLKRAEEFAQVVRGRYGLDAQVFDSDEEAQEHDPFPWRQEPPVVHVDRSDDLDVELEIEELVRDYGGEHAGT